MIDTLQPRPKMPEGWIDFSVGEPHIILESLFKTFCLKSSYLVHLNQGGKAQYPAANGYEPLVKYLENKHQAPVIITNGAKQALGASFYALNKMGKRKLGMRNPYWALIPPLAKAHGLDHSENYDSYLAILPNNPDGFMFDYDYIKRLADHHKEVGIPFIHDAAYYTSVYLPTDYNLGPLGDVQIFSLSKMYGLSGIRVGYAVCYNEDYYNLIREYVDTMTVGVSTASQDITLSLFKEMDQHPDRTKAFVTDAKNQIYIAKSICKTIRKDVLEVPDDIINIPGMFGWFRVGPKCDFKKARINTVSGKLFGDETMVRINLGLPTATMIEAVERLNNL